MQFCSGGSASWVAVVFGLMDLRRAARPSPEPLGRVILQPVFGLIPSCAIAVPGLTASQEPTSPPPTAAAKPSMTSWVVSDPTATYVVMGSADAAPVRPNTSAAVTDTARPPANHTFGCPAHDVVEPCLFLIAFISGSIWDLPAHSWSRPTSSCIAAGDAEYRL